ncbi:MAG: hypothetical protein U0353_05700 [Sandaracinus sp.]
MDRRHGTLGVVALALALVATASLGCANGRSMNEARDSGTPAMDAGQTEFPDAFFAPVDAPGLDAASVDAPIPDAFRPSPDAFMMGPPDAFVPPVDARAPDAAGACMEGARVTCASSCGTTGSALCTGGHLGTCEPPAERCNGADDDCDGARDDGFACALGASEACTTSCGSSGWHVCNDGCTWGTCAPPLTETCNGRDETCDGNVDEGFRARLGFSTYTELSARHAPCDGVSERVGPNCNAAIHRYCGDGCTTSGFGPIENSGDVANVSCVIGEVRTVAYAELSSHHAPCDGVGERWGPNCNAAIHRYCSAHGFVSGFGPVENDGGNATVTCLGSAAEVRLTSYTELSSFLAPCDGFTQRMGDACNAAISRYCGSLGFTSGYGPIENSGDTAYVTCVRP